MNKEVINEGQSLLDLLQFRRRRDDLSMSQLGNKLGIDSSYISQLFSGKKRLAALNQSAYRKIAEYLDLPVVICYLLAGKLVPSDFFVRQSEYRAALDLALETIARSQQAMSASVSLQQLVALNEPVQLLLVMLYESAEGGCLLPERVTRSRLESFSELCVPFEVRFNVTT